LDSDSWGDTVKYAAYFLNSSPSQSNPGRKSLLALLEGKVPLLLNIVVFGSTCMVYRNQKVELSKGVSYMES
jgi:hypothetical protein